MPTNLGGEDRVGTPPAIVHYLARALGVRRASTLGWLKFAGGGLRETVSDVQSNSKGEDGVV